jgi:acetolactate synthase-1/2/3 large subunit
MTAAQLFVQCLQAEGVQYVFGVPGEENEDLLFALAEAENIDFIPCRHEQGAAFIANVWGRLTGKAGVCLSTLGPGATNLITGVADANLDKAPLVAITGQGSSERVHHESHQLIDVVDMFQPVTKWNTSIESPRVIPEVIRKAFKVAEIEKPGATHIELPENIAAKELRDSSSTSLHNHHPHRPAPNQQAILRCLQLLKEADRPLILAGNGVVRKSTREVLDDLISFYKIPVVTTFMGKGAISDQSPQSLMAVGLGFKDYVIEAFEQADLVITIGYDIAEYAPENWNTDKKHTIVHIDFTPAEVYEHYVPKVELIGDIELTLKELKDQLYTGNTIQPQADWYASIRQRILDDLQQCPVRTNDRFTVPGVLHVVRELLEPNGLVISDVGAHKMWIARNFPTYCPGGCIISNGMASMGISLPGGIAARLVDEDRQIISMMGDGGFLMNVQELETAKRLGTGYTILLFNDNDYGLISWKQNMSKGSSVSTQISNPDFVQLANSFGIEGYRPESEKELRAVLSDCLSNNKLALVEVPVDTQVNDTLIKRLNDYYSQS